MTAVIVFATAPSWYPLDSASDASAFGAILSAIVLGITVQLAGHPGTDEEAEHDPHRGRGLTVAPFSLALLLLATYLYIVLAGFAPAGTTDDLTACRLDWTLAGCGDSRARTAALASAIFAVAGTVLALGALCFIFTLVCVIRDRAGSPDAARGAGAFFRWSIFVIVVILVSGYLNVFRVVEEAGGAPTAGYWYWTAVLGLFALPHAANSTLARLRRDRSSPTAAVRDWHLHVAMGVVFVLPAVACMLMIAIGQKRAWSREDLAWAVASASLWFGIGSTAMTRVIPRPRERKDTDGISERTGPPAHPPSSAATPP
jgi:hypothetical protein